MPKRFHNASDVSLAMAVYLASDYYDYNDDPNVISTTTLLKPIRQIILPKRIKKAPGLELEDIYSKVSNRLGASIHDGIERAWLHNYRDALDALGYPQAVIDRIRINPTEADFQTGVRIIPIYLEQRMEKKVGKWLVTGKFDFVGEGKVQDFKTASVWSFKNQVNSDKQIMQGSIYRWLNPKLIYRDTMEIHHIFMDWRQSDANMDPKYPQKRIQRQVFQLKSLEETERYIKNKLNDLEMYDQLSEEELPPCSEEELWTSLPQFKWYKNGVANSKRSTKNFESMNEALSHRTLIGKGMGEIKEVPGMVKACHYCPAYDLCSQKDDLISAERLVAK